MLAHFFFFNNVVIENLIFGIFKIYVLKGHIFKLLRFVVLLNKDCSTALQVSVFQNLRTDFSTVKYLVDTCSENVGV